MPTAAPPMAASLEELAIELHGLLAHEAAFWGAYAPYEELARALGEAPCRDAVPARALASAFAGTVELERALPRLPLEGRLCYARCALALFLWRSAAVAGHAAVLVARLARVARRGPLVVVPRGLSAKGDAACRARADAVLTLTRELWLGAA